MTTEETRVQDADFSPSGYSQSVDRYRSNFVDGDSQSHTTSQRDLSTLVTDYFKVATDFYLAGWGRSFHFAPRKRREGLRASLFRYEERFAEHLEVSRDTLVADLGCGVGGPLITVSRRTRATVLGINNSNYQLQKARRFTDDARLRTPCRFLAADFMSIPFFDDSLDGAYSIEAVPHAPDKRVLFSEVFRVLRPGARFVASDWCMTSQYDEQRVEHRQIRRDIEFGNGLPGMWAVEGVRELLQETGFEIQQFCDLGIEQESPVPWYAPLIGRPFTPINWLRGPSGRRFVTKLLRGAERLHMVPHGTVAVQRFLSAGAEALVAGGQAGIFTPLLFWQVRKPG